MDLFIQIFQVLDDILPHKRLLIKQFSKAYSVVLEKTISGLNPSIPIIIVYTWVISTL